jgi:hypothetical protein
VQPTQAHAGAAAAVEVGNLVRPPRIGDVDLHDHEIGAVVERQRLDVLVDEVHLVVGAEISRQRRQAQRWEQAVLDRAEERAGGLRQGGQDELDLHGIVSMRRT